VRYRGASRVSNVSPITAAWAPMKKSGNAEVLLPPRARFDRWTLAARKAADQGKLARTNRSSDNVASRASTVEKPSDTSLKITWLIRTGPRSSARARCSPDHPAQFASSVMRSSSTFESTSVPSVTPGQRHDLVGAQVAVSAAEQSVDHSAASPGRTVHRDDAGGAGVDHDLHLVTGFQAELTADLLGDGDLALAGYPHLVR